MSPAIVRKALLFLLVTCLFGASAVSTAQGDLADQYRQGRRAALSDAQASYDAVLRQRSDATAVRMARERLKALDEVTIRLLRGLEATRAAGLDSLLADGPMPEGAASESKNEPAPTPPAAEWVDEYGDALRKPLPAEDLPAEELTTLRRYLAEAAQHAQKFVLQEGQEVAKVNPEARDEVLDLCAVLPLLRVKDRAWSVEHVKALPDWLRTVQSLQSLEQIALGARRPGTAYHLARYRRKLHHAEQEDAPSYEEYIRSAGEKLFEQQEYRAALHALRAGVETLRRKEEPNAAAKLQIELADRLNSTGHPHLAAAEAKDAMSHPAGNTLYGRAAVLRLKYLYQADQLDSIVREASGYIEDKRCERYQPQLLYIAWVAHRRKNTGQADRLADRFLASYEKHPLTADIYFAQAMQALSKAEYEEASRLLEIVQYRYPDSRLVKRAKRIRERLEKVQRPDDG